jgi:hypothetical protein
MSAGPSAFPKGYQGFWLASKRKCDEIRFSTAGPDQRGPLLALADELGRQKLYTLSDRVTQQAEKLQGTHDELLAHYRKRIEAAWPGLGRALTFDDAGVHLDLNHQGEKVKDLTPLTGMKLTTLNLKNCNQIKDLTPLKGTPLTTLSLDGCGQVKDLTPLQGMKLTTLDLSGCGQIKDLTPLKNMPLTTLNLRATGQN